MTSKQFDLEQGIMNCWGIVDDIKALAEISDRRNVTEDELQNFLLGLRTIYQVKFEQLFHTFEQHTAEMYEERQERKKNICGND
jgi:hypothetical protein